MSCMDILDLIHISQCKKVVIASVGTLYREILGEVEFCYDKVYIIQYDSILYSRDW